MTTINPVGLLRVIEEAKNKGSNFADLALAELSCSNGVQYEFIRDVNGFYELRKSRANGIAAEKINAGDFIVYDFTSGTVRKAQS